MENLLVSEHAATQVAQESLVNDDEQLAANKLDYQGLYNQFRVYLKPLFGAYAMTYSLDKSIPTVSVAVASLLSAGGSHAIDPDKIKARARELHQHLLVSIDPIKYKTYGRRLFKRACKQDIARLVSGKDYLIPLLWLRLKSECGFKGTIEQLKVQLASHWNGYRGRGLKSALSKALR